MRQTLAILIDAYRDLHSKMLFWITMVLSLSVILAMATIGATDHDMSFLRWHWTPRFADPHLFYRAVVVSVLVIGIWLSWGALILALVSTAGIFPEFIASGSIELYLARPISRLRLFVSKYLASLLFVLLQITVFSIGCFLVIGIRDGEWRPDIFLAIPFITLMFSYIYAFCVLLGVWTRSTVAALLLSILMWLFFSGVQRLEANLHVFTLGTEKTIARVSTDIKGLEERAQSAPKNLLDFQPGLSRTRLEADRSRLHSLQKAQSVLRPLHVFLECLNYAVPKTVDTNNLLDRWLARADDLPSVDDSGPSGPDFFDIDSRDLQAATREIVAGQRHQTIQYIVGSSAAVEIAVLSLAAWIFCRRDY